LLLQDKPEGMEYLYEAAKENRNFIGDYIELAGDYCLKNGLEENRTAMQAIGYRQVVEYLHGQGSLEETKEKIKIRTRQFSKRQGTWFRGQFSYGRWIEAQEDVEQQAQEIAEQYQNFQKDP
ncbi:MAG: hypothetical protein J6T79_05790, partial [Verrucomicrobia bacterium]|nr:hypothetical protein [Verrucomicrobiota bacterium]